MNSMLDALDGISLANQIRLERAAHEGSFLLVEGSSDARLYDRLCDQEQCSIVVCMGKEKLFDAIAALNESEFPGAVAIADRDYAEALGLRIRERNVILSDENDVEIMILCSPALDHVLREYGVADRISEVLEREGRSVRELVFRVACFVGALRLLSQMEAWNLSFDGMRYRFVDNNSYFLNEMRTVQHILGRSERRPEIPEVEVLERARAKCAAAEDEKDMCCGHDCLRVLGRGLRRDFGNTNRFNNEAGCVDLGRVLRLAYEFAYFRQTRVYHEVRAWEETSGFKVLKNVNSRAERIV